MFQVILLITFFVILVFNPEISKISTANSFDIWINKYVPNIFIFLILSDLLINSSIFKKIIRSISNDNTIITNTAYFISLISGIIPASTILKDSANKSSSIHLIRCSILNPAFVLIYANIYVKNSFLLLFILLLNIISNHLFYVFFSKKDFYKPLIIPKISKNPTNDSFITSLLKSIEKNFVNLVKILGIIIFVNILTETIVHFNTSNNILLHKSLIVICSNLEVINGLKMINETFAGLEKIFFMTFSISFLGFSILLQSLFLINKKINFVKFLLCKLIQALFISVLVTILYSFFQIK